MKTDTTHQASAMLSAMQKIEPSTKLVPVLIEGTKRAIPGISRITVLEWRPGGKRRTRKPIGFLRGETYTKH